MPKRESFLTTREAAELLSVSPRTMEKWRLSGSGPRFVRLPNVVRSRVSDLQTWVDARLRSSTSDDHQAAA